jgi:MOSC domain-containing protein YiiM
VGEDEPVPHLTPDELHEGLDEIRLAPADDGELVLIVARPDVGERQPLAEGRLAADVGLVGDNWLAKGSRHTPDGKAAPDKQITVMNIRVTDLVAAGRDRVPLAGDQLYVDLDISVENLPVGSLLHIGDAVLEVSDSPHLGCEKFVSRFGADAMQFVNSRLGRSLRLRGLNARVVVPGTVRVGDRVRRTVQAPDMTSAMVASRSSST